MEREEFQFWLETVGATLVTCDFETFQNSVELPLVLITRRSTIVISDNVMLRAGFNSYNAMLKSLKVTDTVRIGSEIRLLSDTMMTALMQTHLLAGSLHIVPAWTSQLTLRKKDDHWRVVAISNAMSDIRWPFELPDVNQNKDDVND